LPHRLGIQQPFPGARRAGNQPENQANRTANGKADCRSPAQLSNALLPWALPVLLVVVWQIASQAGWLSTRILPRDFLRGEIIGDRFTVRLHHAGLRDFRHGQVEMWELLVVVWQIASQAGWLSTRILPSPENIVITFWHLAARRCRTTESPAGSAPGAARYAASVPKYPATVPRCATGVADCLTGWLAVDAHPALAGEYCHHLLASRGQR
jgi:hypothetical protein